MRNSGVNPYCSLFIHVESQGLGQNCIAHKMVSSLSPIRLNLMFVCIKNTYVCCYVKCPFCCPMLNKISACKEILNKFTMLPVGMEQHSQPSMDYCELLYWCFYGNLSHHFRYHSDWTNLVTNQRHTCVSVTFPELIFDYEE